MIRKLLMSCALCLPMPLAAQQATSAAAGELRVLDKVTGTVSDVTLARGETRAFGLLQIQLNDCRFPTTNPSGDAYVEVRVTYREDPTPAFEGWLIASAPALNAMDHPRYDVWALRCITS